MNAAKRTTGLPVGWVATLLGGVLGGVVGGFLGVIVGSAYADKYGSGDLGDLIYVVIATPAGAWFGAALGVAGMLKVFGRSRPLMSGFVFAAVHVASSVAIFAFGEIFTPQEFNETVGVAIIAVVPPVGAAILSRWLLARDEEWDEPPVEVP